MAKLIGIFGGVFNPIHIGHLTLAQQVYQALACDHIRFIPSAHPPHKRPPLVSAEQRAEMVQLAIAPTPYFKLDTIELTRTDISYTVETLKQLKVQFPEDALCLIMGIDAFAHLTTWQQWPQLFQLAHIIVVPRPQFTAKSLMGEIATQLQQRLTLLPQAYQALRHQSSGLVCQIPCPLIDTSSTHIRQQLSQQQPIDALVPATVLAYIDKHGLYQFSDYH